MKVKALRLLEACIQGSTELTVLLVKQNYLIDHTVEFAFFHSYSEDLNIPEHP